MGMHRSATRNVGRVLSHRKWLLSASLILVFGLWGFAARVQGAEQKGAGSPAPVKTALAAEGGIASSLSYTGDVKAASQVMVVPKATGRIQRLLVDVGSEVKKGDVIAELDSASLKAQVSQATGNLTAAQARLSSMESGPRSEQVAQLKAQVDSAQAGLDQAQAAADKVKKGATENDLQMARADADTARAALAKVKQGPTQTQWWQALGALDTARANMKAAEAKLADVKAGPKPAEISQAEAAVEGARAALYAADDRKDWAEDGVPNANKWASMVTSGGQADKAAAAALANYNAAVEALNLLKSRPLPVELQSAQSAFDSAKAAYDQWSNAVDEMKRGPKPEDIQQAESAVAKAEARLKQMQDGPTEEDIRTAEAGVSRAQAGLEQAQQAYALAQRPFTKNDLDAAKAAVTQARGAVDMAEIALGETSVISPVDGTVSDKFQSEGALVGPQAALVSVISRDVELVLGVEESQIGLIQEGQKAEITVPAYPGTLFPASVALIAPSADPKSRTFRVRILPEANDGKLRQGMLAQVNIVTQEKSKTVVVPKEAVVSRSGQSAVFVLKNGTVKMQSVRLGQAKNGTVEVLSGVEVGDEVIVSGQNDLRDGDRIKKG